MLKACINGARRPDEHPTLPITPDGIAREVAAVAAAGADAVHLHVKDGSGADTLAAPTVNNVLTAVRAAALGVPIGVTTGAWAMRDPRERAVAVRAWRELPDFASVNWHEGGAEEVAAALSESGVAIEAGLWHVEAAGAWAASALRDRCARVLLELPDGMTARDVSDETDRLLRAIGGAGDGEPAVLLHGRGTSTWPALQLAGKLGLATRIGLEDTLTLPDGSAAPDNVALVRAAQTLLAA